MSITIKWFPPSWLQINTKSSIIYIDPSYMRTYFKNYPKKIEFSKWPDPIDGLPEELEPADIILITHDHTDHCKSVTINRLSRKDTLIVAPKRCTRKIGKSIQVISPGEEITCDDISIRATDAYNVEHPRRKKIWHHKGDGVGYLLTIDGKTIYHAGDTDYIPEMKTLQAVDMAFLPIGGMYTMDIREAMKAAASINPSVAIPMHHLKADPRKFKDDLENISKIKVALLQIGELYLLK